MEYIGMNDLINKIHLGDCMDLLKRLPDKSIDLVLTDPPYGIGMDTKKFCYKNGINKNFSDKEWDSEIPAQEIFNEIFRVSKNQIIFGGNYFGLPSRCYFVWDKGEGFYGRTFADCELAFTSFDANSRIFKYDPLCHGDYKNKIHPTQKPVIVIEKCLLDFSNENDLVLDCFSGSGTTAIACHNLKRRFICIEKDPDYWKASVERLEEHKRQLILF